MQVRFYLSGPRLVEQVLPSLARAIWSAGRRLLTVADDDALLARIDQALWEYRPQDFLAHGYAGALHARRQPILLSRQCEDIAANGARLVALADGEWRKAAENYDRAYLLFDDAGRTKARTVWSEFNDRSDIERSFYAFENGRWVQKA